MNLCMGMLIKIVIVLSVNINDMHIIIAPKSKIKNRKPSVDEEYRLIKIIVSNSVTIRLKMKEL